jgi:hypothetical protein
MPDYAVMHKVLEHCKRNFTRIRAFVLLKGVLRSQAKLTTINLHTKRLQSKHTWCQYNFNITINANPLMQAMYEQTGLRGIQVHLPVADD